MAWHIWDVPFGGGGSLDGCHLAPEALRAAGLVEALGRGNEVVEHGVVVRGPVAPITHPNPVVRALPELAAWNRAVATVAAEAEGKPLFLGGDHSVSAGTLSGMAAAAARRGRPLFVLWIDAHPDFHTLDSTSTGNLHGVPLAYACGQPGFAPFLPAPAATLDPGRLCLLGTRSIDPGEREALFACGATVHDMAAVRAQGVSALVDAFLTRVAAARGLLHVSFDVDVLDPVVAPAVGTAVAGGLTLADAQALMARLRDSELVTSLDVVELNPTLDDGGTARLVVDLVAHLTRHRRAERKTA